MSAIKSILKLGINALSETDKLKGQSLPNVFKKMGVKEEELKFADLDIDPKKTYSKSELQTLEAGRKDKFEQTKSPAGSSYQWVSLPQGKGNPTYQEKVYTFKEGSDKSRYTSEHFPDVPNYLMHTRVHDDAINGTPTRVIQEIQSDLHQRARVEGYAGDNPNVGADRLRARELAETRLNEDEVEEAMAIAERNGYTEQDLFDEDINALLEEIATKTDKGILETPYQKSWLAKGIEREVADAIQDGRQQIAIPVKGVGVENLKRAEGVQKWYETNVVNTAKKIAKQQGMDFELSTGDTSYAIIKPKGTIKQLDKGFAKAEVEKDVVAYRTIENQLDELFDKPGNENTVRLLEEQQLDMRRELVAKYGQSQNLDDALGGSARGRRNLVRGPKEQFTPDKKLDFKLYSTPAAGVGAAYLALKAGKDPRKELETQGFDAEDIEGMMADVQSVNQAVTDGIPFQEVMDYLGSQEAQIESVTPQEDVGFFERRKVAINEMIKIGVLKDPTAESYGKVTSDGKMSAQELLTSLQVVQPNMASITTRISGAMGNNDDYVKSQNLLERGNQRIIDLAKERGIDLIWQAEERPDLLGQLAGSGQFYIQTEQGSQPLTPGIWDSIKAEGGEIAGAITGGVAGAKSGAALAVRAGFKHPVAIGTSSFLGSLFGAATGAIGGTEIDYIRESIDLQEGLSMQIAARKALTAGEASVIGDFIGYNVVKMGGAVWNGVLRAKNLLSDGNTIGARKALMEMMFVTDEEASDIVTNLRKATQDDLITDTKTAVDFEGKTQVKDAAPVSRLTEEEETIRAMVLTQPGGEEIVRAAGTIDPQAGRAVAKAIDDRAKDVLKNTAALTEENVGRILVDDLNNYTADVKKFYGDVKEQVAKSPRINNFEFDYEKLGLGDVLARLEKNIVDKVVQENFILQSKLITSMSDSRTLTDLLEVRQLVNDFKFNRRITKQKDFKMLNQVLAEVDGAIKEGAGIVMENPKQWLSDFTLAKANYAKMKGLERNVIARALGRPGLNEDTVTKSLVKYISSIDGTFQEVMSKLPMKSRKLTEGAVINTLATKFTDGAEGGLNVINFPLLSKELDKVTFTTPDARKAKVALTKMAEVFRNDIQLADSTGHIQIPKFQSYLTANPVVRAQFEIASSVFNKVKQLSPTKAGANAALVLRTAELLEKPLNAKLMKEVMEDVTADTNLSKQIIEMQQAAVRATSEGKDIGAARVNVYGTGNIVSLKGTGKGSGQIPAHRIATYEIRKRVADTYGINLDDTKRLDKYLSDEGYIATQQGTNKLRRIK